MDLVWSPDSQLEVKTKHLHLSDLKSSSTERIMLTGNRIRIGNQDRFLNLTQCI